MCILRIAHIFTDLPFYMYIHTFCLFADGLLTPEKVFRRDAQGREVYHPKTRYHLSLFCGYIGLFSEHIGFFSGYTGLFFEYTNHFRVPSRRAHSVPPPNKVLSTSLLRMYRVLFSDIRGSYSSWEIRGNHGIIHVFFADI